MSSDGISDALICVTPQHRVSGDMQMIAAHGYTQQPAAAIEIACYTLHDRQKSIEAKSCFQIWW